MPRLKMVDVGLPYKKIMQGSKWIGRVYKNAQGTYTGQIGKAPNRHEATATTERAAFEEVGARFFGQPSAAALHQHNADVRASRPRRPRRSTRSTSNMLDEMLRTLLNGRPPSRGTPAGERLRRMAADEAEIRDIEAGEDDFVPPTTRRN